MGLEIVLPRPPFRLAICTRNTDETLQSAFRRSFFMSSRLVVTIAVIIRGKADVFDHALGVTALEWFRVFAFMFSVMVSQRSDLLQTRMTTYV